MQKRIVLTGGGTAGHVVVNLALIPHLLRDGWEVSYIGSLEGMEKDLVADIPEVRYYGIPTGKFRRYLSAANVKTNMKDIGHVFAGWKEARRLLKTIRPDIVFSKGGYVAVPVALAARTLSIPVISHESDMTPGLANKLTFPFAKRVLVTFEKTASFVPKDKAYYLGPIIRDQIKEGSRREGLIRYGFSGEKPVLLILGGSLGAATLNRMVWDNLDPLLEQFDILHGVGAGKGNSAVEREGYRQVDFIKAGLNDALAMADVIISRAGSNAIFEFLYYRKPMLLIPFIKGSRGDQVENAEEFARQGFARVLDERTMTPENFLQSVRYVFKNKDKFADRQRHFEFTDGVATILSLLETYRLHHR